MLVPNDPYPAPSVDITESITITFKKLICLLYIILNKLICYYTYITVGTYFYHTFLIRSD